MSAADRSAWSDSPTIIKNYFLYLLIPSYKGLAINAKNKITVPNASSQFSFIST